MAATHWHDWDRRVIGWFLAAVVVLVVLVGNPRGEPDGPDGTDGTDGSAAPDASPARLCGSLNRMAAMRDDLVAGTPPTTVDDLRAAAGRTRAVGTRTRGLDAQAEAGLVYFAGLFEALPDRPTRDQLLTSGAPASVQDQSHADAFVSWLQVNCPQAGASGAAR